MVNGWVYLDESGNTGLNLLDPDQPTYALAGWLVRADQADAARAAVTRVASESGSGDLKGSRMMRSATGRARAERVIGDLRQLGCQPAYSLYEKRYAVAAKIVDAFLDSAYNDHLPAMFDADSMAKQSVAQQLYNLPDGSLAPAWDSIRAVDPERMRDSLNALVGRCRILGADGLAYWLAGARGHVERIAADLADTRTDPMKRQNEALPGTSLITIASAIDVVSEDSGLGRVEIVHDETSSFQPNLKWWFDLVSGPKPAERPSETVFSHGWKLRVGYAVVRSLRFAVSEEEPLVQAADILAAVLATPPGEFVLGIDDTNPGLVDEYARLMRLSAIGYPVPCIVVGSTQFSEKIATVVARASDALDRRERPDEPIKAAEVHFGITLKTAAARSQER